MYERELRSAVRDIVYRLSDIEDPVDRLLVGRLILKDATEKLQAANDEATYRLRLTMNEYDAEERTGITRTALRSWLTRYCVRTGSAPIPKTPRLPNPAPIGAIDVSGRPVRR